MFTFLLIGVAGTMFGRVLVWDVPRLAKMIWRGLRSTNDYGMNVATFLEFDKLSEPTPPTPPRVDEEMLEAEKFIDCPAAFWLEPTRWDRQTWPVGPSLEDAKWNGNFYDKVLVFAALRYKPLGLEDSRKAIAYIRPASAKRDEVTRRIEVCIEENKAPHYKCEICGLRAVATRNSVPVCPKHYL